MQKNLYLFLTIIFLCCSQQGFSQATCATAVAVTVGTQQCGDSAGQVGDFPNAGGAPANPCNASYNDDEYWFSIVGDGTNAVQVDLSSITDNYTGVFLLDDCPANAPTCVASATNGFSSNDLTFTTTTALTMGTTYYIVITNWGTPNSTAFCLDVALVAPPTPPANDECANAIPATVNPDLNCGTLVSGTTLLATESQAACTGNANDDVWFSFIATSTTHTFEVSNITAVVGTSVDMGHEVFSGACTALVSVVCSDPNSSDYTGFTVGDTYYVRVHSWTSTSSQTFDLCIGTPPPPPANDECAAAVVATVNPDLNCGTVTSGTTLSATESQPGCTGTANDDVWFSFVATNMIHTFDITNVSAVSGTSTDMVHEVFSGTCGALVSVDCTDPNSSQIDTLVVGDTYYVRVYSYFASSSQTFDLCIGTPPAPPANDECADAEVAPVNPDLNCATVVSGTTLSGTESMPGCTGTANDDVWFSFVATDTIHYFEVLNIVPVIGTSTDMGHEVFSGSCGALTSIGCSDPNTSDVSPLTVGDTYYVRVHSWGSTSSQTFDLCIGSNPPPPANDSCAIAEVLPVQTDSCATWTVGDNGGATDSSVPDPSCGAYGGGDLWYEVVVPASGNVTFDVQNVSWTSVAAALYSGPCATLVEEDCTEFSTGWPFVFTGLTPGTYYLRAWDYSNNETGTFEICGFTTACSITELAAGAFVACDSVANTFSQEVIVTYSDEPGTGTLDVNGQSFPITGSPQTVTLTGLTPGGTVDVSAEFSANTSCALDSLDLIMAPISCLPPIANDDCSMSEMLPVQADSCATWTVGDNTGATDSGELPAPTCGDYQGGDMWYEVTVPASGTVNFDVQNVSWTSVAASLYSGACGTLTEEDCTEFSTGWPFLFSGLTPGTYYLRVWDYSNNQTGTFEICAYEPAPCNIDEVSLGVQTVCDTLNGTYTQEVIVTYTGASGGTLTVNGQTETVTTSPQTITLTGLTADGMPVTVDASITGDNACMLSSPDLFTAPASCFDNPTNKCDGYTSSPGSVIDDNNDPVDMIMVAGVGMTLADLNVVLKINHTYLGDLDVTLTSPAGTVVDLTFDNCASNDNMEIEFDDEATAIVCGTPTVGVFTPDGNLSDFDGEPFDGSWTLTVVDDGFGDDGILVQWCLIPEFEQICNLFAFTDTDEVSCQGTSDGAATVTGSFGSMPYTYLWDANAGSQTTATAVDLAVGVYLVTVTDSEGCTDVAGVLIEEAACDFCELAETNNTDICVVINADPSDPLANLDCDGDGVTNGDECNDETDPSDPCMFFDTSITEPVTADLSDCANLCQDLTVVTSLVPNTISGMSPVTLTMSVVELNGVDTDPTIPISVRMPSDPRLQFTWDAAANPNWNYLGDNGITHTWRYTGNGGVLAGGTTETIDIATATYDPQGTDGSTTISVTVVPFSGRECKLTNNSDPETLVYFQ